MPAHPSCPLRLVDSGDDGGAGRGAGAAGLAVHGAGACRPGRRGWRVGFIRPTEIERDGAHQARWRGRGGERGARDSSGPERKEREERGTRDSSFGEGERSEELELHQHHGEKIEHGEERENKELDGPWRGLEKAGGRRRVGPSGWGRTGEAILLFVKRSDWISYFDR